MPSSLTEENLNGLCKEILQLDYSIRFIGIANNLGSLVATAYRNGLIPLMNKQEPHIMLYKLFFVLLHGKILNQK
jgi:hypothetical protein